MKAKCEQTYILSELTFYDMELLVLCLENKEAAPIDIISRQKEMIKIIDNVLTQ